MTLLLDTGPWVALMSREDRFHDWAKEQFGAHTGPLLTCEAVVSETCFLLSRASLDAGRALEMIERGVVRIGMSLTEQSSAVRNLYSRYENVPASLADACLIRMSELHEPSRVLTLDSDFHVYRRHGRKAISVISPN